MSLIQIPFPKPIPGPIPQPDPIFDLDRRPLPKLERPWRPLPLPWFRECTPKVLVVTDGLNYAPGDSFGLTEFVGTLRASIIHGMTPTVLTAQFDPSALAALSYDAATQHLSNFKFADPTHGVRISRYDVVFLLGIYGASGPKLTDEAGGLDSLIAFMQAGGGVFATGDHEDLGAGMCKDIPRVRSMRYWSSGTPSAGGTNRLTTNLPGRSDAPGSNDVYEFGDQSDRFPQRLYVNYVSTAGGVGVGHPVLQVPAASRAIEVFPDHPHEGECIVPTNLASKLPDGITPEWPQVSGANHPPEVAAVTMSHGNSFPGKAAVAPRSFIAICAYDGQAANVGRVVTDATWHHFVNINIKPGMSALAGRDLSDIKQYYANLATWLMPKSTRLCRRFPWLLAELVHYPLFEELSPLPRKELDGPKLVQLGTLIEASLLSRNTKANVDALLQDALEEALGPEPSAKLGAQAKELGIPVDRDAARAALASLTLLTAERFNELQDKEELSGEKAFADLGAKASTLGASHYLKHLRRNLSRMTTLLESMSETSPLR